MWEDVKRFKRTGADSNSSSVFFDPKRMRVELSAFAEISFPTLTVSLKGNDFPHAFVWGFVLCPF